MHLTWTVPVIAIVATYAFIVLMIYAYLVTCVVQPAYVFLQSFPLIVLGQADPSLATLPTGRPQPTLPSPA